MNKSLVKILIPVFVFTALVIYLFSSISIWYPEEAKMGLAENQAPFIDLLFYLGQLMFEDSIWSVRWSTILSWALLVGVIYNGSKNVLGKLAAKYTLVITLACIPLLLTTISQPQITWMLLWDSVSLLSVFHLVNNDFDKKWRTFFWVAVFFSLGTTAFHTVIICALTISLLPKTYKTEFIKNSQFTRYLPIVLVFIAAFILYNHFIIETKSQYILTALMAKTFETNQHFNFVAFFGLTTWGLCFILLLPIMLTHFIKGLQRKTGKIYILSIWVFLSLIYGLIEPLTVIPPLSMLLGLSIYALEQKYLSNVSIRIWAVLQLGLSIGAIVILLYLINQQFGYWGIFWGIISGIILMSSTIFFLLMYESKKYKMSVQGLLSINVLFVILLFIKVLPNFHNIINSADEISQHVEQTNKNATYIVLDDSLYENAPLRYQLKNNLSKKRTLILSKDLSETNDVAYTIIKRENAIVEDEIKIDERMTIDTFYMINYNPNEIIGVYVMMK